MNIKLVNIGYGSMLVSNRLITVFSPESAPIKRTIKEAKERGLLIDATYGRKTRSVIITDCDKVILCAVQPETISDRVATVQN